MKIQHIQRDIEESLASLATSALPPALAGLRHLPLAEHSPRVSIRNRDRGNRKVREDADAGYFDPKCCEVAIAFVPLETSRDENSWREAKASSPDGQSDGFNVEAATDELVEALKTAEATRPFVGLKWFRDQFLPGRGHGWTQDPEISGTLLRHATDRRLILTSQVPNPNRPLHPVTAIRVNRKHPRFRPEASGRGARMKPVRIRGGSISDTVLGDRR